MGAITALFSTSEDSLLHRLERDLSQQHDIKLLPGAADEPQLLAGVRFGRPNVALIDADLFGAHVVGLLDELVSSSSTTKVLLLYADCTEARVLTTLVHGASGCLGTACGRDEVLRAIRAVHAGEFWAPRKTLAQAFQQTRRTQCDTDGDTALRAQLSPRECEIVEWVRCGLSNKEIARTLGISDTTVKTHVHNIFHKLEVSGRVRMLRSISAAHSRPPGPAINTLTLMQNVPSVVATAVGRRPKSVA